MADLNNEPEKAGCSFDDAKHADDAALAITNILNGAYAANKSDNDAPLYEGDDYTKKPQAEWSDEEWVAFREFRPPISYNTQDYAFESAKSWNRPNQGHVTEAGNINVSNWSDADWYYYWFTNAQNSRDDGQVYTRSATKAYSGPLAERDLAQGQSDYRNVQNTYHDPHAKFVKTFYGNVDCDKLENMGRNGNVGVPYAYALVVSYDDWYDINIEAENEARQFASKRDKKIDSGHVKGVWSGREWLRQEDKHLFGGIPNTPGPYGKSGANAIDASTDNQANSGEWNSSGQKADDAKRPKININNADIGWSVRCAKARTAPYRNMGIITNGTDARYGKGDAYYDRNVVPGMPGWYKGLNGVLNHIPWRALAWAALAIVIAMKAAMRADGMDIGFTLLIGAIICGINQTGYFTNMIRGLLRGLLDGALKIWAHATKTDIDWVAARIS